MIRCSESWFKFCCWLFTATTTGSVSGPADGAESGWQTPGEYGLCGSTVPVLTQVYTQIQPDRSKRTSTNHIFLNKHNF